MHSKYLNRCLELAKLGETGAYPNPIVGCVIVQNGKIIGEGFHKKYGEAHAEVNAINTALQTIQNLEGTTIYVSLEPCSHFGKTPPCSDLIIKHKFKTLVYACADPNPLVSGKGITAIKKAGIEVIGPETLDSKIIEAAQYLNRVFFKTINQTPWITVKIAVTEDGLMIPKPANPQLQRDGSTSEGGWISNPEARKRAHRLRSSHQLLITGINTVKNDNPEFNVRHSPADLNLAEIKNPDILILKDQTDFTQEDRTRLKIFNSGRKILEYSGTKNLQDLVSKLSSQGYNKILLEAGPKLTRAFIEAKLVDELIIYQKLSQNFYTEIQGTHTGLLSKPPEFSLNNPFQDQYLASNKIKYFHLDFSHSSNNKIPDLEIKITAE